MEKEDVMPTRLPKDYSPSDDEPFMNARQREYFRRKLVAWKDDIIKGTKETVIGLQNESVNHPDDVDRANSEAEKTLELRTRDRQRKLVSKIDSALRRIDDKTYGYCEESGDPISLKRLDARPIATMGLEAQERHEKRERVYRDD
jgi:DnaK suppressor protein